MTALALIDAGGANLGSVRYALERLGVEARIVRDADGLGDAERIILPGVGAAAPAMALLRERGLVEPLRMTRLPLLGICLGMQLLFDGSDEGDVACLGLLPGRVRKLASHPGIRVPHMGWNTLQRRRGGSLVEGIADGDHAYFVHSYAAAVDDDCLCSSEHGQRFAAVVQRGNVAGAQFHPERSGAVGARLLKNFIEYGLQ